MLHAICSDMIRCGHRTALVDALPTSRTSRPSMSRIRPLIHSRRLRHWAHLAKTASNIPFRCSLLRVATLSPLNRPAAGGDARHLAAAAGGVDGSSSSSRSTRSYLERWAGVHGGTVARSAAAVAGVPGKGLVFLLQLRNILGSTIQQRLQ